MSSILVWTPAVYYEPQLFLSQIEVGCLGMKVEDSSIYIRYFYLATQVVIFSVVVLIKYLYYN